MSNYSIPTNFIVVRLIPSVSSKAIGKPIKMDIKLFQIVSLINKAKNVLRFMPNIRYRPNSFLRLIHPLSYLYILAHLILKQEVQKFYYLEDYTLFFFFLVLTKISPPPKKIVIDICRYVVVLYYVCDICQ